MHHNFLFDLDQTLLDFHASEYKALGIVLRSNGLPYSDDIYRAFKEKNKSLWLELEKGTITRTELFTTRFEYIIGQCGGNPAAFDLLKVNDDFIRTMSENGVLMDGALEFIKNVKETIPDSRIYIASNGATINAKGRIASTGLDKYIDYLFISEDMGVTKPDAEFFDICLEKIGEPKSTCIMIGDSLSSDMLGAKNASMDSVWFMPSGDVDRLMKEYDINYTASSFDELYEILKKEVTEEPSPLTPFDNIEVMRAEEEWQRAGAYSVRIQGMNRQHHIPLREEFDGHDADGTRYIVLLDDGYPIATCRFYEIDPDRVVLGRLVVLPEYRGNELGLKVIEEAEKWIGELGYKEIMIDSRVTAVGFYEKAGYKHLDDTVIKSGDFDCIKMNKKLV